MSYAHNNHYKWIENNCNVKCSELGKEVANILGWVGRGIYNASIKPDKVDWQKEQGIEVNWFNDMSNYDGQALTDLVIECHRRMVRVTVKPCNMQCLKLKFWKRKTRDMSANMFDRMPDIEYMIQQRDKAYGVNNG